MTCRVSIEEERHDRQTTERQKRIDALYVEAVKQYQNELHAGEIGEIMSGAIGSWIAVQASKEVERVIDRGDV
jgi:hypothetical protein